MTGRAALEGNRRFDAEYASLGGEASGSIALLTWDADAFGFRVADYRPGDSEEILRRPDRLRGGLQEWCAANEVELVGCRIGAGGEGGALAAALEEAGFRFVETQLHATLSPLRSSEIRPPRVTVRTAAPADHARIAEIAATAFDLGRYHADPRFPRELADRRYRAWMERALLAEAASGTWVGVLGADGSPAGFLHAEISGRAADIRLAAVSPEAAGIGGPELFRGALNEFARRGVSQVTARISAANTAVMNVYAALKFRFHDPEAVFHWHRPGAPNLLPREHPERRAR